MIWECIKLFFVFFKIGIAGFGGGYAMLSMIVTESEQFHITVQQIADLNVLDMVVPGPIAINSATYVGYLHSGFWGALSATIGVCLPSLIIVSLVLHFIVRYRKNRWVNGFLLGVKPAAVGLIAAAAATIAGGVLINSGMDLSTVFSDPLKTISLFSVAVFVITAVANIRFRVNPILLTLLAGVAGALLIS
jgi:chromate transporter